ncbi:MAG: 2-amino-4-hydroxy-6-hydroxymethyldihydropteridine diphosphokinase [Mitsuokella sp.]|uniref:2-amino-4-hydroxy-6- hydroxymethyldihydropteridine diphosphokinase n=1 Tax=Mitsuokella sp. TaxID=2049034 RepID=UPI003EFBD175
MKARICYLSLGANLGKRGETLREALRRLAVLPETKLVAISPFYETAPWGKLDQPAFLNAAAAVETQLEPLVLLRSCQQIEQELGRVRHEHWGARTIDIDLLHIPGVKMVQPELTLPHPYLVQRAFVLRPLADIAGDMSIEGRSVREWCRLTAEQQVSISAELADPWPLRLIACLDAKGGLGYRGDLLVRLPEDMKHFRELTIGQAVIMGRRTMESLPGGRPLPDRVNIVLSKTLLSLDGTGFVLCRSLPELWQELGRLQQERAGRSYYCIGGAEIYKTLLPYTYEADITRLQQTYQADCFFPELTDFELVERRKRQEYAFERYEAKRRTLFDRKKLLAHGNLS